MEEALAEKILDIVASSQRLPRDRVTLASTFEELKIDSLDGINLIFAVEEAFKISIPDHAAHSIRTVGQMAEGVAEALRQNSPGEKPAEKASA